MLFPAPQNKIASPILFYFLPRVHIIICGQVSSAFDKNNATIWNKNLKIFSSFAGFDMDFVRYKQMYFGAAYTGNMDTPFMHHLSQHYSLVAVNLEPITEAIF